MDIIKEAQWIAGIAHQDQYRRDGKTPYIRHVEDVVKRLQRQEQPDSLIAAAWLHDVIEDSNITVRNLHECGIPDNVIIAVDALTKKAGQSYQEYLSIVKNNQIARIVKISDMLSNLSDDPSKNQIVKYSKGLLFLLDEA